MAVQFLSQEWASAVTDALNAHPGFKSAIGAAEMGIQFNTSDGPSGNIDYYLKASGGVAKLALGVLENPDVSVGQAYATASAISKGELNTQTAFMTGKLKVSGNLAKLMMHQAAITQWGAAVAGLEVDY